MNSVASVMNFLVRRTYDERRHCYGKVAIVMKYSTACTTATTTTTTTITATTTTTTTTTTNLKV